MVTISDVQTRYGVLKVPNAETDVIGRFLVQYGEWADLEIRLASELIRPGAAIADIGAFVGTFGIGLSQRIQLSKVCFVEANALVFPALQSNIERCCRASAVALNTAAAPEGFAIRDAFMEPGNLGSATVSDQADHSILNRIPAPDMTISLADLFAKHGFFDLIKMDIEGLEAAVLAEDKNITSGKNTIFLVECREDPASFELFSVLKSSGRQVYYYAFPSFNPANYLASDQAIFPYAFESGLLLTDESDFMISQGLRELGVICQVINSVEDLKSALWHTPRWCPESWWGKSPASVVSLASRSLLGLAYETFLSGDDEPLQAESSHQQLYRTQKALEEAQAIVEERTERLAETHSALVYAERLVSERTEALEAANRALFETQKQVEDQKVEADLHVKVVTNHHVEHQRLEAALDEADAALKLARSRLDQYERELNQARDREHAQNGEIAAQASALEASEAARRDAQVLSSKLFGQVDDLRVVADNSAKIIRELKGVVRARDTSVANKEKERRFLQTLAEHRMLLLRSDVSEDVFIYDGSLNRMRASGRGFLGKIFRKLLLLRHPNNAK